MKKYSNNFMETFGFYLRIKKDFTFCGTKTPMFIPFYMEYGMDAKEAFKYCENGATNIKEQKNGTKMIPTKHPNVLTAILLSKASINFHIKQWAEGMKDHSPFGVHQFFNTKDIIWSKDGTFRHATMQEYYNFPRWVIDAVGNHYIKTLND